MEVNKGQSYFSVLRHTIARRDETRAKKIQARCKMAYFATRPIFIRTKRNLLQFIIMVKHLAKKLQKNKAEKGQDVFRMSSKKGDIFFLAQTIEK